MLLSTPPLRHPWLQPVRVRWVRAVLFDQQSRAPMKEASFDQHKHCPRGSAAPQWEGKIKRQHDNQQRCWERGEGRALPPNDNHPPRQGIEESATTQTTISRRLGGGGRDDGTTTQMTSRHIEGGRREDNVTTQMKISHRLGGEIRWSHHPNDNQPLRGGGGRGGRFLSPAQTTISHGAGGGVE